MLVIPNNVHHISIHTIRVPMKLKYFTIKEIIEDGHGRVERVPTEYNIVDIHSKPTNGTVQRTIGMAVMGHDKIWPYVDPATVTTLV